MSRNSLSLDISGLVATEPRTMVVFYAGEHGQGGELRENLIVNATPDDELIIAIAKKKCLRLNAKSFKLFIELPVIYSVPVEKV